MTSTGEIEQRGVIAFAYETFGSFQAIVQLHHHSGAALHLGSFNARQLLVIAFAAVNHRLLVEVNVLA